LRVAGFADRGFVRFLIIPFGILYGNALLECGL
jgi:hypothetical protein